MAPLPQCRPYLSLLLVLLAVSLWPLTGSHRFPSNVASGTQLERPVGPVRGGRHAKDVDEKMLAATRLLKRDPSSKVKSFNVAAGGCSQRVKCGADFSGSNTRRSLQWLDHPEITSHHVVHHNLSRRGLEPIRDVAAWVIERTKDAEVGAVFYDRGELENENLMQLEAGGETAAFPISTTRFYKFEKKAFQKGFTDLEGCTVICVVSPKAVWMGHFWEVPAWSHDWNVQADGTEIPNFPNQFNDLTLKVLTDGFNRLGKKLKQDSLKQYAGDLENAKIFIMHPRHEVETRQIDQDGNVQLVMEYQDSPLYEDELNQVKQVIQDILKNPSFVPEYLYTKPTEEEKERGTVAEFRGRGLFEFDPVTDRNDRKKGKLPEIRVTFEDGGSAEEGSSVPPGGPFHFNIKDGALVHTEDSGNPEVVSNGGRG